MLGDPDVTSCKLRANSNSLCSYRSMWGGGGGGGTPSHPTEITRFLDTRIARYCRPFRYVEAISFKVRPRGCVIVSVLNGKMMYCLKCSDIEMPPFVWLWLQQYPRHACPSTVWRHRFGRTVRVALDGSPIIAVTLRSTERVLHPFGVQCSHRYAPQVPIHNAEFYTASSILDSTSDATVKGALYLFHALVCCTFSVFPVQAPT